MKSEYFLKPLIVLSFSFLVNSSFAQFIASGSDHSVTICSDKTVKAWGQNNYGQLGDGSTNERRSPTSVVGLSNIIQVSAGYYHTLFLKSDGTVYGCGYNLYGQLGDSTTINRSTPTKVKGIPANIVKVVAGGFHSFFIEDDGDVWAVGYNNSGQLGIGTMLDKKYPVKLNTLSQVKDVGGGKDFSLFLLSDSTVYSCGFNSAGQLGDGTGFSKSTPGKINSLSGIIAVSGGNEHSLFLRYDGIAYACGRGSSYRLGDSTQTNRSTPVQVKNIDNVIDISAGLDHSLFLKGDSTVWGCGDNGFGALGTGNTTDQRAANYITTLSGIQIITTGNSFSLFLKNNGVLYCTGSNLHGQLGNGSTNDTYNSQIVPNLCSVLTCLLPDNPNAISGISSICENSTVTYSTNTVKGAESYNWTVPSGAVINSGQGTTSINVTFGNTSGNLVFTASNTCGDVTATLPVTVKLRTYATQNREACDSLVSPSGLYTWKTSNTYQDTITNAAGCDSILTITLLIKNKTSASLTDEACGKYTVNGQDFTSSGTYIQKLTNVAGCDSILTLNLTIHPINFTQNVTICEGDSVEIGTSKYKTTGNYKDTLVAQSTSCDSIISLNLEVIPKNSSQTIQICQGESYTIGTNTYNSAGNYIDTLQNRLNCDSIVKTNLVVNSLPTQPSISQNGTTLTCSVVASVYRWFKNGILISGAITQAINITNSGNYEVEIEDNNTCKIKSLVYNAQIAGISENESIIIKVYPNPVFDKLQIDLNGIPAVAIKFNLYNLLGEVIATNLTAQQTNQGVYSLNVSSFNSGLYYLEIETNYQRYNMKINIIK